MDLFFCTNGNWDNPLFVVPRGTYPPPFGTKIRFKPTKDSQYITYQVSEVRLVAYRLTEMLDSTTVSRYVIMLTVAE